MSTGVADAQPRFEVTESQASAGDIVHFTISATEGRVEYELEIGDKEIVESAGAGPVIAGEFRMPDLGDAERKVTVEAQIEDADRTSTVKRKLRYLGPAQAPAAPLAAPPVSAPAAPAPASPPPAPAPPVQAVTVQTDVAPAARPAHRTQLAKRPARRVRRQRTAARHRSAARQHTRRDRGRTLQRRRGKRNAARTAPLFDGIPESSGTQRPGSTGSGSKTALNAIVGPQHVSFARAGGSGVGPALLVPVLLGLAALLLAGTALARSRTTRRRSAG